MPYLFGLKFSKNSCQNSNLGFHFAKHVPKSILASCKAHDGVMVHHIVTKKYHLDCLDQPKSFIHFSETLVNPKEVYHTLVVKISPIFLVNHHFGLERYGP